MKLLLSTALAALTLSGTVVFAQDAMPAAPTVSNVNFAIEALILGRSGTTTQLGHNFNTDVDLFTASGFNWSGGTKVSASGDVSGAWGFDVEAFYAGVFDKSGFFVEPLEDIYTTYTGGLTPGNLSFDNSEDAFGLYYREASSVAGFEANATYDLGQGAKLTFGPRDILYGSTLHTWVSDDSGAFDGSNTGNDRVYISSLNNLIGPQIGVSGMYQLNDTFSIGGKAALGLYANVATLNRHYNADDGFSSPFNTQDVSSSSTAVGLAESVEISPKVSVAIAKNVDLNFGGTMLFVNGVDEPGKHYADIGKDDGSGNLAADGPRFNNSVFFGGATIGLTGHF